MDEHQSWIEETRQQVLNIFTERECDMSLVIEKLIECFLEKWNLKQLKYTSPLDEHLAVEVERFIDTTLNHLPHLFVHRYGTKLKQTAIKTILEQQQQPLATVEVKSNNKKDREYALRFKLFFQQWLADESIYSIVTTYPPIVHKTVGMSFQDLFILHLFVYATCKRIKNDNVCCLSITGLSTIGKSTLIENPLEHISYNVTSESGVNRFQIGSKSVLLLHDAHPSMLISNKDANIYRCVARAEICKVKTFGSVTTLPAVFLLLTSNQTIHTHSFPMHKSSLKRVQLSVFEGKRRNSSFTESVKAIQNRFLEIYFCKRPIIDKNVFPDDGNSFTRQHLIVGLFDKVLSILLKYSNKDFYYSTMLPIYCISGLLHHLQLYCQMLMLDDLDYSALHSQLLNLKMSFSM